MAEMKINVSFKLHEKELFDFIKSQRSPSNFIKDAVEFYREHANGVSAGKGKTPQKEESSAPSATNSMLDF